MLQEAVYKKANLSGALECKSASDVVFQLADKIYTILDFGNMPGTIGSKIIYVTGTPPVILGEGAVIIT